MQVPSVRTADAAASLDDVADAVGREAGVQRHEGGTGLERRQHGRVRPHRVVEHERDAVTRADAARPQGRASRLARASSSANVSGGPFSGSTAGCVRCGVAALLEQVLHAVAGTPARALVGGGEDAGFGVRCGRGRRDAGRRGDPRRQRRAAGRGGLRGAARPRAGERCAAPRSGGGRRATTRPGARSSAGRGTLGSASVCASARPRCAASPSATPPDAAPELSVAPRSAARPELSAAPGCAARPAPSAAPRCAAPRGRPRCAAPRAALSSGTPRSAGHPPSAAGPCAAPRSVAPRPAGRPPVPEPCAAPR